MINTGGRWPRQSLAAGLVIFFLTGLAFLQAVGGSFVADELTLLHGITGADGHPRWGSAIQHWYRPQHLTSFRPLMTLWQLSLLQLFGPSPIAFHLASALLQGAVALAAWQFFRLALEDREDHRGPAFWAALLFACHPLQFETVAYVAAASGQLSALFVLGALGATLRWRRARAWPWLAGGLASGTFALASKEDAMMLPFGVLAVTWLDAPRWRSWAAVRDAAITTILFTLLAGVYLVHRIVVFGALLPGHIPFNADVLGVMIEAITVSARRFAAPINAEAYPEVVGIVSIVTAMLAIAALVRAHGAALARRRHIVFSVGLAMACCASVFQVLPFVDSNLSNARYLYLPMLGLAAAFACATTPVRRREGRGMPIILVVCALWCLGLLQANLAPWVRAGVTMAHARREALASTGSDVRVQVANIPDNIAGAFFDRGGWRYARLEPFSAGQTVFRRARDLHVANRSRIPVVLWIEPTNRPGFTTRLAHQGAVAPGTTATVTIAFEPVQEGTLRTRLIAESPECGQQIVAEIQGQGAREPVRQTFLSAAVWGPHPDLDPTDGRMNLMMTVADAADGTGVYGVAFEPPAASGWALHAYRLVGDRWVPAADSPDIPDGGAATYSLHLFGPKGPAPAPNMVPTVRALNAAPAEVVGLERALPTERAEQFPRLSAEQRRPPEARDPPRPPRSELTGGCAATRADIDFGRVEMGGRSWTTGEAVIMPATTTLPWLFWDDQQRRMRALADAYDAAPTFAAGPQGLATWSHPASVELRQVAADVLALRSREGSMFLTRSGLDLDPRSVAYVLVRMRALNGGFFGVLSWKTDRGSTGSSNFGVIPDGMWRIVVIPVHRLPAWKKSTRVTELSLAPTLSGGYVEISDVRLIGPLSDHVVPARARPGESR